MLMAKAPVPGCVKTRLAARCGNVLASEIAAELFSLTVSRCVAVWGKDITLCIDGSDHDFVQQLARRYALPVVEQVEGDLGKRMLAALRHGLTKADSAAVMGCDVPQCPVETLVQARKLMRRGSNVIGPCTDGGYYFLGTNVINEDMFSNVSWSTELTLQQTRASCAKCGVEFQSELDVLRDIDYWEDLVAAAHIEPGLKRFVDQALAVI